MKYRKGWKTARTFEINGSPGIVDRKKVWANLQRESLSMHL